MVRAQAILAAVLAAAVTAGATQPTGSARQTGPGAAAGATITPAEAKQDPKTEKTTGKVPPIAIAWRKDLDSALQESARTARPVVIFFYADWSQPCRWMDRGTFASPAVAQYVLRNFIPVKVDDSADTSPVTAKYQVRVYPTLLFLAPTGEPLHIVLGPRTAAEAYPILEKVAALPRLITAQQKAPDDLEANFQLGNAFAVLNQLKRAEPYLRRAAELAPKNEGGRLSQSRLLLAIVPLEDGDSALAMRNIDAWLREFPQAPEVPTAMYYQGTILFQDGRLQDARRYFDRLRIEFPKHPKAYEADKAIEAIDARLKLQAQQQQ